MSFDKPLEENQIPLPKAYSIDDFNTRIYWVKAVVKERTNQFGVHQYAVRYKNGQHQWWNESDVETNFPGLLKQYKDEKSGNVKKAKLSSSSNDKERKLRSRKRDSSSQNDDSSSEPTVALEEEVREDSITPRKSSPESSGLSKKQRPTPITVTMNKSVGTNTTPTQLSNSDDDCENEGSIRKNTEVKDIGKSPSPQNAMSDNSEAPITPDKTLPGLLKNLRKDPRSIAPIMAALGEELARSFVEPAFEEKEAKIAELKSRYEEEKKELKGALSGAEINMKMLRQENAKELKDKEIEIEKIKLDMEKLRKDYKEKLEDKDRMLVNLDTEIERKNTYHLETLREILGNDNYLDTDNEAILKQKALQMIRKLNMIARVVLSNAEDVDEVETESET